MDCAEVREEFSALLDSELDMERQTAVMVHLSQCPACLRELDRYRRVNELYEAIPQEAAPAEFEQMVQAKLKKARPPVVMTGQPRTVRWRLVAAGIFGLIIVGAFADRYFSTRQDTERFKTAAQSAKLDKNVAPASPAPDLAQQTDTASTSAPAVAPVVASPDVSAPAAPVVEPPAPKRAQTLIGGDQKGQKAKEAHPRSSGTETSVERDRARRQEELKADVQQQLKPMGYAAGGLGGQAPATAEGAPAAKDAAQLSTPPAEERPEMPKPEPERPEPVEAVAESAAPVVAAEPPPRAPAMRDELAPRPSTVAAAPPAPPATPAPAVIAPESSPMMIEDAAPIEKESAALSAPPAMEAKSDLTRVAAQERVKKAAEPAAEKRAEPATKGKETAEQKVARGETFVQKDGTWRPKAYKGQRTRKLLTESREFEVLFDRRPQIEDYLALGHHVIFKLDGLWYEIRGTIPKKD